MRRSKTIQSTVCYAAAVVVLLSVPIITNAGAFSDGLNYAKNTAISSGGVARIQVTQLVLNIITTISLLLGYLALLMIIIGGLMYITSAGDEGKMGKAKQTVLSAVIGLIVAGLAWAVVNAIAIVLNIPIPFTAAITLKDAILNAIKYILQFVAVLAVAAVVYGGFTYITAAGSDEKIQRGKKILVYAAVGIAIALLSGTIVNIIISL